MSKQYSKSEQSEEQQKTRARIVSAAAKVLAEKGYEAATLKEISREAQAAPGLVHYYFGGKDQLLVEALQAAGQRFHNHLANLVESLPADQSLEAFLTQLHERVEEDPEVYRLRYESFSLGLHNPLIAPRVQERMVERRQEIGLVLAKVIQKLEHQEDLKTTSLDPEPLAAVLLSVFDGLALQKIMDPGFDLDAPYRLLAQMMRDLFARALAESREQAPSS